MRKSRRLIVFFLLLFLGTNNYVHTAVYYAFNGESSASIASPDVYLEEGTAGTSVIYPNATSAASQVDSHATTFYPNDYNVTHGLHVSGSTPGSVNQFDSDYFTVNSSGSHTSNLVYTPLSYTLLNGTSIANYSWGITTSSFGSTSVHTTYRYMGGTSPDLRNMTVTKLHIRLSGSGTAAIALYTGGSLDDPTGAVKRTEAYNVTVSAGWNEIDVPDYNWENNTVTYIGWAHNTGIYYSGSSTDSGDFQAANGRWNQPSPADADETSAMPTNPGAGSFANFWYAVYVEYELNTKSSLYADDESYMRFRSYPSASTDDVDPVDDDSSDVDGSPDKGFDYNFTYQQSGPDSTYDLLREQYFGNLTLDYVDNNTTDVDSSAGKGTHSNFANQQSGPDSVYDLLKEEKMVSANDWGINTTSFTSTSVHTTYRYTGGTSPDLQNMTVTKLHIRTTGSGTVAIALYTGGSLDDPTGAVKRTEAYNVAVSAGWNEIDVPDYEWPNNTVSWIGWAHDTGVYYSTDSGDAGDFQTARGRWDQTFPGDADETSAMPTNPGGGSFDFFWYAVYAEYNVTRDRLDLEAQWTDVPDGYLGTEVAIRTGSYNGTEQLQFDFWNSSSQWQTLGNLVSDSWNNFTITPYLTSSNFTVRFKGASETSDSTIDAWNIDASMIRLLGRRNFEYPVENNSSDIDSSPDIGIQSDFAAQQSGPDSTYDVLTETKFKNTTLIDAESFEGSWPPSGWTATGGWNAETDQAHDGLYSADIDGGAAPGVSGDLDTPSFNCSGVHAIYVSFWFMDDDCDPGELRLQYWDGSMWDEILNLTGYTEDVWNFLELNISDSQYFVDDFQVRFTAYTLRWGEHFYLDEVTIIKEEYVSPYEDLDIEVQWTNLDYDAPNEELCIHTGSMGAEDLVVEIWNTSSSGWDAVFSDLTASSWNNASITGWLTSETVTIRYRGNTTTGDAVKDQWEIDVALIHIWQNGTAEYSLDMEYQWTGADFTESGEELCIYGGTLGAENILVDVWFNKTWNNVFTDLSPGWNNVSVTQYLNSSKFTIRVRDGTTTSDALFDTWEIDVSLLHLWGETYTAEVVFEGTSNLYEWPQIEWIVDSAWTNASIRVDIRLYNYTGDAYPESGNGFTNYTSGPAYTDETANQVITDSPMDFRNATSWWKIKVRGEHWSQFDLGVDYIALNVTYYDEYTAQTEFIFTDITDNQSPNLNFTVANYNSVTNVNMTIQVYNYTSGSYPTSGQGYLNYVSNWLAGWDQRVKLTIDHNDVDSDLSDFPALIHLGTSSGRNDDDVSFVFDELQNDANRRKIAVTTGDGATQCYVEIEEWDDANEEAWLWVKVPSVNSTSDTELYLYYDADHADNTAYVGDPNSSPAEAVWDDDFRFVSHMRDDSDTSHIRDSTGYDNDGTKTGANEPVVTIGNVSDAQDFDGGDDIVDVSDDASMNIRTTLTMEAWVNATVYDPQFNDVMSKQYYDIYIEDGRLGAYFDTDAGIYDDWPGGSIRMVVDTWYYVAVTYDSGAIAGYIDGALDGTDSRGTTIDDSTGWDFIIGWHNDTNGIHWEGIIDEVRVSNASRSGDWIETSFESGRDDLVDFGGEDTYTTWLNITNNAQSCLSGSYARIRVTSVYSTTDFYQQLTNFVRLLQEESTLVNDYALRVTNNGTDIYTVRLVRVSDSNIDRIINCTIYFRSGETQLQVIDGAFTLTTGTWANLPAASSLDIIIDASTIHIQYSSVIETELEVLRSGTSTYTKYPIQFTIT
jgi:hypothetical protein